MKYLVFLLISVNTILLNNYRGLEFKCTNVGRRGILHFFDLNGPYCYVPLVHENINHTMKTPKYHESINVNKVAIHKQDLFLQPIGNDGKTVLIFLKRERCAF